jgi:hypothetical protein
MRAIHILAVLLLGSAAAVPCAAGETSMSSVFKQFMSNPDSPIILRGDYLKATLVAYQDFKKVLSREAVEANSNGSDHKEFAVRLSKIENYDISIDQTPTSYIVQFGLTVRDKAYVVFGGGFQYLIDRKTFAISKKVGLK